MAKDADATGNVRVAAAVQDNDARALLGARSTSQPRDEGVLAKMIVPQLRTLQARFGWLGALGDARDGRLVGTLRLVPGGLVAEISANNPSAP